MVAPSSFLARHTINSVQILINIALCVLSVELTGDGQSPHSPPEAMLYLVLIVYSTAINSGNISLSYLFPDTDIPYKTSPAEYTRLGLTKSKQRLPGISIYLYVYLYV